jgi:hypothetical protein
MSELLASADVALPAALSTSPLASVATVLGIGRPVGERRSWKECAVVDGSIDVESRRMSSASCV